MVKTYLFDLIEDQMERYYMHTRCYFPNHHYVKNIVNNGYDNNNDDDYDQDMGEVIASDRIDLLSYYISNPGFTITSYKEIIQVTFVVNENNKPNMRAKVLREPRKTKSFHPLERIQRIKIDKKLLKTKYN